MNSCVDFGRVMHLLHCTIKLFSAERNNPASHGAHRSRRRRGISVFLKHAVALVVIYVSFFFPLLLLCTWAVLGWHVIVVKLFRISPFS